MTIDMDETFSSAYKGSGFITFGVSFFVLAAFWWLYHNYFRRTKYRDNGILALNCILLYVILYYVLPLKSLVNPLLGKVIMSLEALASLFQLYSLGFVLIFLCLALMYSRACKITRDGEQGLELYFTPGISAYTSWWHLVLFYWRNSRWVPGIIYAILGPLCYLHGENFNKKYKSAIE